MPATRATAIAATLLAVLALGIVLIFARDRTDAIVTSVIEAVVWAGLMLAFRATRGAPPPPLAIQPDELPQTVSQLATVVRGTVLIACLLAAAIAYSLDVHSYITCGIALGAPIMIWDSFRRASRTEREMGGTLWAPAKVAWKPKGRYWFLVTETADWEPPWGIEPQTYALRVRRSSV